MNISVYYDGTDITNYVISFSRKKHICTGIGQVDVEVVYTCPEDFTTYHVITIYEETIKKGEFYIGSIDYNVQGNKSLSCQDGSKRLQDFFSDEIHYTDDEPYLASYWVGKYLTDAGVSYVFDNTENDSLMSNNSTLGPGMVYDLIIQLLNQCGWYIYFDENNLCHIGKAETGSSGQTLTKNTILAIGESKNDKMLRNRVKVWGDGVYEDAGGFKTFKEWVFADESVITPWNYDSNDYRTVLVANSNIPDNTAATNLARYLIGEFARINDEITVSVAGGVDTEIAETVFVDSKFFVGEGVVTAIEVNALSSGFITILTLNQRCPRLTAFFNPAAKDYVYIGTAGAGVWRKPIKGPHTWSNFSSGLTNLNIIDLDINAKMFGCVDISGGFYTRKGNTSSWVPYTPPEFIDETDGITVISGTICTGTSVDKKTNHIYGLYTYSGLDYGRTFIVDTTDNSYHQVKDPVSLYDVNGLDIDNNGKSIYVLGTVNPTISGTYGFELNRMGTYNNGFNTLIDSYPMIALVPDVKDYRQDGTPRTNALHPVLKDGYLFDAYVVASGAYVTYPTEYIDTQFFNSDANDPAISVVDGTLTYIPDPYIVGSHSYAGDYYAAKGDNLVSIELDLSTAFGFDPNDIFFYLKQISFLGRMVIPDYMTFNATVLIQYYDKNGGTIDTDTRISTIEITNPAYPPDGFPFLYSYDWSVTKTNDQNVNTDYKTNFIPGVKKVSIAIILTGVPYPISFELYSVSVLGYQKEFGKLRVTRVNTLTSGVENYDITPTFPYFYTFKDFISGGMGAFRDITVVDVNRVRVSSVVCRGYNFACRNYLHEVDFQFGTVTEVDYNTVEHHFGFAKQYMDYTCKTLITRDYGLGNIITFAFLYYPGSHYLEIYNGSDYNYVDFDYFSTDYGFYGAIDSQSGYSTIYDNNKPYVLDTKNKGVILMGHKHDYTSAGSKYGVIRINAVDYASTLFTITELESNTLLIPSPYPAGAVDYQMWDCCYVEKTDTIYFLIKAYYNDGANHFAFYLYSVNVASLAFTLERSWSSNDDLDDIVMGCFAHNKNKCYLIYENGVIYDIPTLAVIGKLAVSPSGVAYGEDGSIASYPIQTLDNFDNSVYYFVVDGDPVNGVYTYSLYKHDTTTNLEYWMGGNFRYDRLGLTHNDRRINFDARVVDKSIIGGPVLLGDEFDFTNNIRLYRTTAGSDDFELILAGKDYNEIACSPKSDMSVYGHYQFPDPLLSYGAMSTSFFGDPRSWVYVMPEGSFSYISDVRHFQMDGKTYVLRCRNEALPIFQTIEYFPITPTMTNVTIGGKIFSLATAITPNLTIIPHTGNVDHIETSNFGATTSPYIFYSVNAVSPQFFQKDRDTAGFTERSTNLPNSIITIIRLDDRI